MTEDRVALAASASLQETLAKDLAAKQPPNNLRQAMAAADRPELTLRPEGRPIAPAVLAELDESLTRAKRISDQINRSLDVIEKQFGQVRSKT